MCKLKAVILGVVFMSVMALSTMAWSAPVSFVYNDTIGNFFGSFSGLSLDNPASITVTLDNGGMGNIAQTWTASDLQSVTFNFNSGVLVTTFNSPFDGGLISTSGDFETGGSGTLTAVMTLWRDTNVTTDLTTNGSGTLPFTWVLNGGNNVYYETGRSIGLTSTLSILDAANWSQVASVPTPSAMLLMGTGLLGLIGYRKWTNKTN